MKKTFNLIRYGILGVILAYVTYIYYMHAGGGNAYPSVHAICPLGGLENFWAFIGGQNNISKIFSGTMVLFFFLILFALIFGRAFCGNICPFGTLQEFFAKINPKKLTMPKSIDRPLRYLKFVVLALVTFMAWKTATLWITPYDPWVAYSHIFSGEAFSEYGIAIGVLIFVLLASILYDRFFCKYLCPAGALYALIAKLSPTKVYVEENCTKCQLCNKSCPMDIEVYQNKKVNHHDCITCGKCVDVCPVKGKAIHMGFFKKKFNIIALIIVTVGVFFGGLAILSALGIYQVSVPSVKKVSEQKEYMTIDNLRGSMSIEEGAFYSGFELTEFYTIMEIPTDVPKDTLLKDLSTVVDGYDFHVIKAKNAGKKGSK